MSRLPEVPPLYRFPGDVAGAALTLVRRDLAEQGLDADLVFSMPSNKVPASFRLGYRNSRYIRRGAAYTAHALRLAAGAIPDGPLWAAAMHDARWTFASAAHADRASHGLKIRRALLGETAHPHMIDAAEAVGKWLGATTPEQYLTTANRAARWAIAHVDDHLRDAWYATHGLYLLQHLQPLAPEGAGRPAAADHAIRELQRHLARRVFPAISPTRVRLASEAGVTRVTLNAWLAD